MDSADDHHQNSSLGKQFTTSRRQCLRSRKTGQLRPSTSHVRFPRLSGTGKSKRRNKSARMGYPRCDELPLTGLQGSSGISNCTSHMSSYVRYIMLKLRLLKSKESCRGFYTYGRSY